MKRAFVIALVALFAVAASTATAAPELTIGQLQKQVKALQNQVKALKAQIADINEAIACDEVVVPVAKYGADDGSFGYSFTQNGQTFLTTALDYVPDTSGMTAGDDFEWFVTSDPACVSAARPAHRPAASASLDRTIMKAISKVFHRVF
jgi:hypothetical protein